MVKGHEYLKYFRHPMHAVCWLLTFKMEETSSILFIFSFCLSNDFSLLARTIRTNIKYVNKSPTSEHIVLVLQDEMNDFQGFLN